MMPKQSPGARNRSTTVKSKKKTRGMPQKDVIVLCNKNGTGHEHKEWKQEEHDKLFEYDRKGKMVRVKFESELLKYDLNELFKNHTFYEPVPLYSKMFDGQPLKPPEFPVKRADGVSGYKEETLRE